MTARPNEAGAFTIEGPKGRGDTAAEPDGSLQHRIEHRREIAGGGIDNLQDLGCRGLLFERLAGLRDEPRVLDRDHRLGSEVLKESDLLVGEGASLLATCYDP